MELVSSLYSSLLAAVKIQLTPANEIEHLICGSYGAERAFIGIASLYTYRLHPLSTTANTNIPSLCFSLSSMRC